MADVDTIREQLLNRLPAAIDLGHGLLRSDRKYEGKTYATAYIDLSDDVVERANDLWKFQENLLGAEFFESENNQRWNSYLYFWAGPKSTSHPSFRAAKLHIERDRHFARKFVLTDADLLSRLDDLGEGRPKTVIRDDVRGKWEAELRHASLSSLLEQKPRTRLIALIEGGEAFATESRPPSNTSPEQADPLDKGTLYSLRVEEFRPKTCGTDYTFGDVNLIIGPNGSGKTSLLELIEALYCGRVRRDDTATCSGLRARMRMRDGRLLDVVGQMDATTIKRRNLVWYGRSDYRTSAISDSFARFNFLDTDAAYRLYSEGDVNRIKEALNSLLVGPETSILWAHLTKLHEDVSARFRSLDERVSSLSAQRELVRKEVQRLEAAPSQASSLAKTYRASLRVLGARWSIRDGGPLDESDRARLEELSHGFVQALAVSSVSPWTVDALRARHATLESALEELARIQRHCNALKGELKSREAEVVLCREGINSLQQWRRYSEAGIVELVTSIDRIRAQMDAVRLSLGGITIDAIPAFPPQYASTTITEALRIAVANLSLAQTQERTLSESLDQRQQVGQSLRSLKAELRTVARAVVERSGDSIRCPVCGTPHETDRLLEKIDALAFQYGSSSDEGMVLAIHEARQRAHRENRFIAGIKALGKYATSSGAPESMTVGDLRDKLVVAHRQLNALTAEAEQLLSQRASFSQSSLEVERYHAVRDAALAVLSSDVDAFDIDELQRAVEERSVKLQAELDAVAALQESIEGSSSRAHSIVYRLGIQTPQTTLEELVAVVRGELNRVAAAVRFLEEATMQMDVPSDRPIDALLSAVDAAIEAFDRAQHAEANEYAAQTELSRKMLDLLRVEGELEEATVKRKRFAAAEQVLRRIAENHSLEEATREALNSIRKQVGYIFERIHAPCEYELGDFDGDSILLTLEGKEPRKVNQVSTGQRAALALSIFLALNQSAEHAPRIMLIDDPVAHVDDLNVLSFLDHLRDLVVAEGKQVFFATADTRIAALFEKKFEFLGEDRFKQISLLG